MRYKACFFHVSALVRALHWWGNIGQNRGRPVCTEKSSIIWKSKLLSCSTCTFSSWKTFPQADVCYFFIEKIGFLQRAISKTLNWIDWVTPDSHDNQTYKVFDAGRQPLQYCCVVFKSRCKVCGWHNQSNLKKKEEENRRSLIKGYSRRQIVFTF